MGGMRYQPQGPARLNRTIPQLAGAVAIVGNNDTRNGRRPSPTTVETPLGRAAGFAFTGNLNVPYAPLDVPLTSSWTVLMVIRKDADRDFPYFLGTSGGRAANTALTAAHTAVERRLAIYDGSAAVRDSGILLEVGRLYVVALSFDGQAGQFSWFADGIAQNTSSGVNIGGSSWHICGTSGQPTNVTLPLLAIIPRALPASLARALTANPWQLFEEEDDIDVAPLSAVQHVLAVQGAAFGLSGGQVRMTVSRRLSAAPASLDIGTGQVSMRAARRLAVAPAGMSIAGGDVGMRAARRLGVAPAGLVLARGDISLRAARRLAVAPAALVLTGGQVEMQYAPNPIPGSYTLPVATATMALRGGEVRMRVSRRLPVQPALIQLIGGNVRFEVMRDAGAIDASLVPASRTVQFGGGQRTVIFSGGTRVVTFNGCTRIVRF